MALNSTAKSETAESYGSVADADSYFSDRGMAAWAALSTTQKEQALRRATEFLDRYYGDRWLGEKTTQPQALDWPRVGVTEDGWLISSEEIPRRVQRATFEAAYLDISGVEIEPDNEESSNLRMLETNIGSMEVTKEWGGTASDPQMFTKVNGLLKPFIKSKLNKQLLRS
jgi:hypothetical protein